MNEFRTLRDKLFRLYINTWVAHWITRAGAEISVHEILGTLYQELQHYIDELTESRLSAGTAYPELLPIGVKIEEIQDTPVAGIVISMKALRNDVLEYKDPILDDWKGRLLSTLNHYIFILDVDNAAYKLFSNKEDTLLVKLRSLFKNQQEFVTKFNAYLKSKSVEDKYVEEFFKTNEEALSNLSEAILTTNAKLFDIRESLANAPIKQKKDYNTLVNFFDVFVV